MGPDNFDRLISENPGVRYPNIIVPRPILVGKVIELPVGEGVRHGFVLNFEDTGNGIIKHYIYYLKDNYTELIYLRKFPKWGISARHNFPEFRFSYVGTSVSISPPNDPALRNIPPPQTWFLVRHEFGRRYMCLFFGSSYHFSRIHAARLPPTKNSTEQKIIFNRKKLCIEFKAEMTRFSAVAYACTKAKITRGRERNSLLFSFGMSECLVTSLFLLNYHENPLLFFGLHGVYAAPHLRTSRKFE